MSTRKDLTKRNLILETKPIAEVLPVTRGHSIAQWSVPKQWRKGWQNREYAPYIYWVLYWAG